MKLLTTIKRNANVFVAKNKNSISIVGGAVIIFGAGVWAVYDAITKTAPVVAEIKEDLSHVEEVKDILKNEPELAKERGYSEETPKTMKRDAIVRGGLKITKIHIKHVIMSGAGLGFVIHGVHGFSKDISDISACLAGSIAAQQEILERVERECDPETAARIKYGVSKDELEDMKSKTREDDWETLTEEEKMKYMYGDRRCSKYSFFYTAGCTSWTKEPIRNRESIELIRAELEDLLMIRGFININDIYRAFGNDQMCRPEYSKLGYKYSISPYVNLDYKDFRFINGEEPTVEIDLKDLVTLF